MKLSSLSACWCARPVDCVISQQLCVKTLASFPGSPRIRISIRGESLVSFLHEHDVIEMGLEEKSNILHVVQPHVFNAQCVWYSTPDSQIHFFLFWVFEYAPHNCSLSTFDAAHVRNTRLSTPTQLRCLCSGEWEPGNEAMKPYL